MQIPTSYFIHTNKLILKFVWTGKRPRLTNKILKNNKARRETLPTLKTYYKTALFKTVQYWQRVET